MKRILLTVAIVLPIVMPSSAVEREAVEEDQDVFVARGESQRLGYESESKLTGESAAKSFFYLNNERPLPEKKEIAAEPKPKPQPKPAVRMEDDEAGVKPAPRPPKTGQKKIVKEPEAAEDTQAVDAEAAPAKPKPRKAGVDRAAAPAAPRKAKPVTKAVALPDIEEILADVRRAAEPQTPSDRAGASQAAPVMPASPFTSEVTVPVDMDQLAQDLANFQAQEAGAPKKPEAKPEAPQPNWWIMTAVISGTAAAIVLAVVLARRLRRRPKIRTQAQIDAETRAFFAKLSTEHKRVAVEAPAPAPKKMTQPSREEEELAEAFSDAREEPPAREVPVEEPHEPAVFLLPPELDNEAYKDVIRLAAEGASADAIAERLNMGEGEVRLVLDLARMSHERIGAS